MIASVLVPYLVTRQLQFVIFNWICLGAGAPLELISVITRYLVTSTRAPQIPCDGLSTYTYESYRNEPKFSKSTHVHMHAIQFTLRLSTSWDVISHVGMQVHSPSITPFARMRSAPCVDSDRLGSDIDIDSNGQAESRCNCLYTLVLHTRLLT